jgi:hypothetical protein
MAFTVIYFAYWLIVRLPYGGWIRAHAAPCSLLNACHPRTANAYRQDLLDLAEGGNHVVNLVKPDRAPLAPDRPELAVGARLSHPEGDEGAALVGGQADPEFGTVTAGERGQAVPGVGGWLRRGRSRILRVAPHDAGSEEVKAQGGSRAIEQPRQPHGLE